MERVSVIVSSDTLDNGETDDIVKLLKDFKKLLDRAENEYEIQEILTVLGN